MQCPDVLGNLVDQATCFKCDTAWGRGTTTTKNIQRGREAIEKKKEKHSYNPLLVSHVPKAADDNPGNIALLLPLNPPFHHILVAKATLAIT